MPADLDLDAIEARCDAATPGPWRDDETDNNGQRLIFGDNADDWIALLPHQCVESIRVERDRDAAFIAHAREDLPALVAEVRRVRPRHARLEAAIVLYRRAMDAVRDDDEEAAWLLAQRAEEVLRAR